MKTNWIGLAALSLLLAALACAPATTQVGQQEAPPVAPKVENPPATADPATRPFYVIQRAPVPKVDPNSQAYKLEINEKPGTTWKYRYENHQMSRPVSEEAKKTLPAESQEVATLDMRGTTTVTVAKVDGDTIEMKLVVTVDSASGRGFGKAQAEELLKAKPATQTIRIKKNWGQLTEDVEYDPLTNSYNNMYPDKPVRVGDTWTFVPFPRMKDPSQAAVVGKERVQGRETLRIEILQPKVYESSVDLMTVWVDPTNGRVLRTVLENTSKEQGMYAENRYFQEIVP